MGQRGTVMEAKNDDSGHQLTDFHSVLQRSYQSSTAVLGGTEGHAPPWGFDVQSGTLLASSNPSSVVLNLNNLAALVEAVHFLETRHVHADHSINDKVDASFSGALWRRHRLRTTVQCRPTPLCIIT